MLIIAHRGANREAPENSFAAIEAAIDGGAQRCEIDLQLTADSQVVIMHDSTVLRTTNFRAKYGFSKRAEINAATRAEISSLMLEDGSAVPFLDDCLRAFGDRIEFNVEIKGNNPELAAAAAVVMNQVQPSKPIVFSCMHPEPLRFLYEHHPEWPRACLHSLANMTWPRFAHLAPGLFMDAVHGTLLHPHVALVTENMVDQARRRGWKVIPFASLDSEEDDREGIWSYMKHLQVDGLCTNYPRQFSQWLAEVEQDEKRNVKVS